MTVFLVVAGALAVLWILANSKTSRPDGVLVPRVHPYRRIMQYIMPTRSESVVFFDTYVPADALLDYVEQAREQFDADITHCVVGALAQGLAEAPTMNRFVAGRRLYQRRLRHITFSMKRTAGDERAKLATVKLEIPTEGSFRDLCARINEEVSHERSDTRTYADKEFDLLGLIPRPVLIRAVQFLRWLDHHNLVPAGFIATDPLHTSVFVANLGSLGMDAGYHHLYEWGNCPIFVTVGRVETHPVVVEGEVVPQRQLHLRWTYDERIDDGLSARRGMHAVKRVLEDPFSELGCVGSGASAEPQS
ncbi:2-oxo acid dehydrogenase subunit E2 [Haliangium sp.]|uniref:2-oxo acid dehydrogenase subunit E2 n=1 Tax=Haliangium sp. TaxID=2663208 RepID=UPI003D0E482F